MFIDTDKCLSTETNHCDANADCASDALSITCKCKSGYAGNGTYCQGKTGVLFAFFSL